MQENAVLVIGLTDQSDYIICHFMVRVFIGAVVQNRAKISILLSLEIYQYSIGTFYAVKDESVEPLSSHDLIL